MQVSIKLGIRCALELCAILCDGETMTLENDTYSFIQKRDLFPVTIDDIHREVTNNLAARLFSNYGKKNPARIKKINLPKELLRKLWLAQVIGTNYETISLSDVQTLVAKKFDEEKSCDRELSSIKFGLFEIIDNYYRNYTILYETGKIYSSLLNVFPAAYQVLSQYFEQIYDCEYMIDIYNSADGSKLLAKPKSTQPKAEEPQVTPIKATNSEEVTTLPVEPIPAKKPNAQKDKETALRDLIGVLEKDKHNLELQISHAKNDVVRELLSALTDNGWGAPLSELYLVLKDNDTPEKVRGIINNLFMALGSQSIKPVKEKMVGQTMVIDAENQRLFDPLKNEEIVLNDEVLVCYPGFRYERETIVRPKIKKKQ